MKDQPKTNVAHFYCFDEIAGNGTDIQKTLRLMQWLTDHTFYSGMSTQFIKDRTSDILQTCVNKSFKYAINCRFKAIALTKIMVLFIKLLDN